MPYNPPEMQVKSNIVSCVLRYAFSLMFLLGSCWAARSGREDLVRELDSVVLRSAGLLGELVERLLRAHL